ncbi:MAG: hypothetical protein [Circular genetic element sp.]|nr:MAG: hypothetical protein [Circular genetic element sp.]
MWIHVLRVLEMRTCKRCSKQLTICTCRLQFKISHVKKRAAVLESSKQWTLKQAHHWCGCDHTHDLWKRGCCEQMSSDKMVVCYCQPSNSS